MKEELEGGGKLPGHCQGWQSQPVGETGNPRWAFQPWPQLHVVTTKLEHFTLPSFTKGLVDLPVAEILWGHWLQAHWLWGAGKEQRGFSEFAQVCTQYPQDNLAVMDLPAPRSGAKHDISGPGTWTQQPSHLVSTTPLTSSPPSTAPSPCTSSSTKGITLQMGLYVDFSRSTASWNYKYSHAWIYRCITLP